MLNLFPIYIYIYISRSPAQDESQGVLEQAPRLQIVAKRKSQIWIFGDLGAEVDVQI